MFGVGRSVCCAVERGVNVVRWRCLSSLTKQTPIGIVGMGNVGDAVGKNLLRHGFNVKSMYDVDEKAGCDLNDQVARVGSSREVAEVSDVVITCLPKPEHVAASYTGDDGLLAGFRQDAVWIDHSTTAYVETLRYHEEVKTAKNVDMVEAPITGGLTALQVGTMVTFLGGDKDVVKMLEPLLAASYTKQIYLGPVGSALITKVMSNMLCMLSAVGMAETMMIAKRSNIDLVQFWHAMRAGCGQSFAWETAGPSLMRGDFDPTFTIDLHCKDLDLGYQIAKKHKVPIPLHGLVQQMSNEAMYKYGPEAACYSAQRLYEDACGETLRADGFQKWRFENRIIDGSVVPEHTNIEPSPWS